jgi:hypothetical protein
MCATCPFNPTYLNLIVKVYITNSCHVLLTNLHTVMLLTLPISAFPLGSLFLNIKLLSFRTAKRFTYLNYCYIPCAVGAILFPELVIGLLILKFPLKYSVYEV